jgi:6-phosphogluconolactonase (cycloisomerase 2 family)
MSGMPYRYGWWIGLLLAFFGASSCKSSGVSPGSGAASTSTPAPSPLVVYASAGKLLRVYDLDAKTGALEVRQTLPELKNDVHYIAVAPSRKYLYVSCSEIPPPKDRPVVNAIYAFSIDGRTGALTQLGDSVTPPSRAINITVDNTGNYLLMAHNFAENVSVLKLKTDGSLGEPVKQADEKQKLGFLVHQIRIDPSNKWVFVPVRGDDAKEKTEGKKAEPEKFGHMNIFEFNDGALTKHKVVDYPTLMGPRHLDFHPSKPWIYVAFERGNRIVTYKHENGVLTETFNTTTLQDPSFKFSAQRAGPIHVHPNGKWVYIANRSVAPNQPVGPADKPFSSGENDVAVFSIDGATGEPKLIQNIETHGFEARTLTIDPTGHFLVVANQKEVPKKDGDKIAKVEPNLSVFRIGDDGKLTYVHTYEQPGGEAWWVGAVALP